MENSSPCAQHIVALLQHKAGVMIEIVGREKKNGKAGGEKMMGFAYILPTIFFFFFFFACIYKPVFISKGRLIRVNGRGVRL